MVGTGESPLAATLVEDVLKDPGATAAGFPCWCALEAAISAPFIADEDVNCISLDVAIRREIVTSLYHCSREG